MGKIYTEVGLSEWLSLPQDSKKVKVIHGRVKFFKEANRGMRISVTVYTKVADLRVHKVSTNRLHMYLKKYGWIVDGTTLYRKDIV